MKLRGGRQVAHEFVPDLPSRPLLVKDRRLKAQEDERQTAKAVRALIAEWEESRNPADETTTAPS
ncbi:hypothetical protein ACT16_13360 [Mycobacterium heckeshornense]|nr:hypothetical protein ACT16_13360 [Mycobacterium heckeshornense]